MTKPLLRRLTIIFFIALSPTLHAGKPTTDAVIDIIATHEYLPKQKFKVIHITLGSFREKSGFEHPKVARVSVIAPRNNYTKTAHKHNHTLRHYIMHWSKEYGWFLQQEKSDARGVFIEISSETKGRVFMR